jgi:GNAT superfamily N-acetyltransferase
LRARAAARLIEAAARNHRQWMSDVVAVRGGRVWSADGIPCVHVPPPQDEVAIPFPDSLPERGLDAVLGWCRENEVRRVGLWRTGLADDPVVETLLRERGFVEGWRPHWMGRSLDGLEAPEGAGADAVEQADDVADYDAYGRDLLRMSALDPRRNWHFIARAGGRHAGHAWLHVAPDADGVACLFDVFVNEDRRRRGLGTALTLAACAHARRLGCEHMVLNAEADGEQLYGALGFSSLGHGQTWWHHSP